MNALNNIRLGVKLIGGFLIMAVLLVIVAVVGFINMQAIDNNFNTMYTDRLVPIKQLDTIRTAVMMIHGDVYENFVVPEQRNELEQEIAAQIDLVNKTLKDYKATKLVQAETEGLAEFELAWAGYQQAVADILKQIKAGDEETAVQSLEDGTMHNFRVATEDSLNDLMQVQMDVASTLNEDADRRFTEATLEMEILGAFAVLLAIGMGIILSRSITGPLGKSVAMMQELGKGLLGMRLKMDRQDEIGVLARTMDQFAEDLQNIVVGTMKKIAGGDLSTEVTPKDARDEIAPALKATIESLRSLVAEFRLLTQASVDGKLDTRGNTDKFQGGYREIVQGVNNTLDAILIPIGEGNRVLRLIRGGDLREKVEIDCKGDHKAMKEAVNGVHTWLTDLIAYITRIANGDMTATMDKASADDQIHAWLVLLKNNINALVADANLLSKAAVEGKLATRADATRHQGDFRKIVQGVDDTLDAVIGPLNVAAEYVDRIAKGDIPAKITDSYNGDFNEIKNNLNQAIDAVNALVADANLLSKAAVEGKLATRADAGKHNGDFRKIVQGVNDTLDAVIGPLNVAARYVDDISKGNIPPHITDSYNGDFNTIKNNLNQLIDSLNEITGVTVRIATGDLKVAVKPRSAQDELMKSLGSMLTYLQEMATAADQLAAGNLDISVTPKSKDDMLGNAFAKMIANLQQVIGDIVQVSQMLAEGDLRVQPEGQYLGDFVQIKTGLETALAGLNQTMQQTSLVVEQVNSSVEQVRTIGQDMASNSEEQSSAAEEVASSLQESDSQVKANAENANIANQLVNGAALAADSGQKKMQLMTEAMGAIAQSSRMIGNIIKVIDEIAFQTNLLALNAAVEAARAGQHGRGFAVVAQEVRNLAGRSAKAAKETAELIEDSTRRVKEGVKITGETATSLGEIVQNVVKVKDLVAEIAAASEEQSKGIAQIGSAMTQVSQGAQSSSRQGEELAGAADELAGLAEKLSEEISRFKLLDMGSVKPTRTTKINKPQHHGNGSLTSKTGAPVESGKLSRQLDRDERGFEGF